MTWLASFNAFCNASCALCLLMGFLAIKRRDIATHQKWMVSALCVSALFLMGYLTRVALTGTHRFPGTSWVRNFYIVLLFTHTVLAVILLPLVLRTVFLARRVRFPEHRTIARFTWPIWMYVSVTGVVVYTMLYHVAPQLR